jgi:TPP-dependent pyruvate/acetoin dehydrogenase alpha subunit
VDAIDLLRRMMLIRAFEAALAQRKDHGFQLFSSGQEATSVGVCAALRPSDQLLASGRSIAAALARGLEPGLVMAELLGKSAGPNKGKAGRGHLASPEDGFFGAHAVVAGNIAIAAGVALAAQLKGAGDVVACVFGDGACGAGILHETLNLAALWRLPLLFVCDNNGLSIATPTAAALAPTRLADLAAPFGIPAATVDGMDVLAVRDRAAAFVERARGGDGPAFLECRSARFFSHSTSTRETRSLAEMAALQERCPIRRLAAALRERGELDASALRELEVEAEREAAAALAFADAAPYPDASEALADVG